MEGPFARLRDAKEAVQHGAHLALEHDRAAPATRWIEPAPSLGLLLCLDNNGKTIGGVQQRIRPGVGIDYAAFIVGADATTIWRSLQDAKEAVDGHQR